ncbi:MAG TPA: RidA family protein [Lysobacter sp.]|nr:RidA family protein [Lysobacter sp.]
MSRQAIHTDQAPAALGPYSQAVGHGNLVFLSGQVGLDPASGTLVEGGIEEQARQVFRNLRAVCQAAGGDLDGIVKLTIYLVDLGNFALVNAVMAENFAAPYPARATIEISALPAGAEVEVEAVLGIGSP